jgi:hypothetical protein
MKTKYSLSILGIYNSLMGIITLFFASSFSTVMVNSSNNDVLNMGELFHYGLSPALLIIGLMLLLGRNASVETSKKLLLAYIIGTLVLMYVFFGVMANSELMNFSFSVAAPDMLMLGIALFGYFKAK